MDIHGYQEQRSYLLPVHNVIREIGINQERENMKITNEQVADKVREIEELIRKGKRNLALEQLRRLQEVLI